MAPLFSIIIPVYNVQDYLERSVDSVLCQDCKDYEVILVDDGSPDNCPKLCDDYSKNGERVRVIHKENGGSSSARNEGLMAAQGRYILFLDSDDYWLSNDCLSRLKRRIEAYNEDIILYSCKIIKQDGCEETTRGDYNLTLIDRGNKMGTIDYLVSNNQMPGAAWIMAVRNDLVRTIGLQFPVGLTAEDYSWCLSLLAHCSSIGAVNGDWYAYVKRDGSITASAKVSGLKGMALAINQSIENGFSNNPSIKKYLQRIVYLSIMSFSQLSPEDKTVAKNIIKPQIKLLPLWARIAIYMVGFNTTSRLIRFVYGKVR